MHKGSFMSAVSKHWIEQDSWFHFYKFLSAFKWAGDRFLRSSVDSASGLMRSKLVRLHSEQKVLGRQKRSPKTEQLPDHSLTLAEMTKGPSVYKTLKQATEATRQPNTGVET